MTSDPDKTEQVNTKLIHITPGARKFIREATAGFMKLRQSGAELARCVREAESAAPDETYRKLFLSLVMLAYEHPIYGNDDLRELAVKKFSEMAASVFLEVDDPKRQGVH
ncbi:hypothetical protein [Rhizobium herbae]|uniref:hypothetical protein n=1 Tax=Rhizobium herbae TaxID=508661 RepID=UPI001AE87597|nr:hypothetical protein [Rhizobium herbae]